MSRSVSTVLALVATAALLAFSAVAEAAPPKPNRITLNVAAKTLTVGQKFTVRVKSVKPPRASKRVRWSSSKKRVATVTARGVVKAVRAGTATITARSVVRPRVKRSITVTVKNKKPPVVIDRKLLGSWGLFITDAGSLDTYRANGIWTSMVIIEGSLFSLQQFSKGNYQAKNGKIYYSNIVFQSRKNDDEPWSAWKPAAEPDRIENYEVGTDEYGEYLSTEEHPNPITPDSVKYRRSE